MPLVSLHPRESKKNANMTADAPLFLGTSFNCRLVTGKSFNNFLPSYPAPRTNPNSRVMQLYWKSHRKSDWNMVVRALLCIRYTRYKKKFMNEGFLRDRLCHHEKGLKASTKLFHEEIMPLHDDNWQRGDVDNCYLIVESSLTSYLHFQLLLSRNKVGIKVSR